MKKELITRIVKEASAKHLYVVNGNTVEAFEKTLIETLHQALNMSDVVEQSELLSSFLDYSDKIYWGENDVLDRREVIEPFLKNIQ